MLSATFLALTNGTGTAQTSTDVEKTELPAALESGEARTLLEVLPGQISSLTSEQIQKASQILLNHLSELPPDDAVGRKAVADLLSALINAQVGGVNPPTEAQVEVADELHPEIRTALADQDGAKLVALVLEESFSVTSVSAKKTELIEVIAGYARPLPAADAKANKEAYQALAILDPENAVYNQKAASYSQAERDAKSGALKKLKKTTDEFNGTTFYTHPAEPRYADTRSYLLPYIAEKNGNVALRVHLHYTADSWLFVDSAVFNVDGKITPYNVPTSSWLRDNDSEIWEWSDTPVTPQLRALLEEVANSNKTIVRFNGQQYYDDFTVTDQDKAAIRDVLAAEEILKNMD